MVDVSEIERRVDRAITATIPVSTNLGGLDPKDYGQVMEFAKVMATCKAGIPQWLRGSVGDCLMIATRAMRWRMDPYFVAEKSYLMVNTKSGEARVGYESQLIHAVIESLAPLKGRLRHEIMGDGDDRYCVVWGTFKGEDAPHRFVSETLGKRIRDIGKSEKGNFRGSPLWLQKPTVQLFYDASRDWARVNCPDVLAGVYTRDELPDHEPMDVTPPKADIDPLMQRLRDAKKAHVSERGFDASHVDRVVNGDTTIDSAVNTDDAKQEKADNEHEHETDVDGRHASAGDRGGKPDDESGSAGVGGGPAQAGEVAAGSSAPQSEKGQGEIFPPGSGKPESVTQSKKRKR